MGMSSDIAQNLYTTTDATPTTVTTYSFPQNCSALITLRIIGTDSSQDTYVSEQRYVVKRQTGSCSIVGIATTIINEADLALATASSALNVNGGSIEASVTGVLSTTINWGARIDILYLS